MLSTFVLISLILITFYAYHKAKQDSSNIISSRSFFLHNETLSLKPLIATLVASNMSLGNMIFICGLMGYFYGYSGVFWVFMTIVFLGLGFMIYGTKLRVYIEEKGNFGTIHDYLSKHHDLKTNKYQLSTKIIAASTSILSLLVAIILEVHIGTMVLSSIFNLDQILLVAIMIILVFSYSAMAGFHTVVVTDILQFIFMIIAVAAGIVLFNTLPVNETLNSTEYTYSFNTMITGVGWQTATGLIFLGFFWLIATPDTWQRNCASRSLNTSKKGVIYGTIIMSILVIFFAIGGMYVKTTITGLVPTENISLLSGGYFAFNDIFLISHGSMSIGINILLTLIAIGLIMAAISTIDTLLIVVSHIFNVDLGLSLKNINNFDDVEKNQLDENLLLRGRVIIGIIGLITFFGWIFMLNMKLLVDPLSLFFITYTIQFALAIPVIVAKNKSMQSSLMTILIILISTVFTLLIGLWGMLNIEETILTLGMTPASWLALLPVFPVIIGIIGYSIIYINNKYLKG